MSKFLARDDEKETDRMFTRFYVTLKASVVGDFQHQMHLDGIPVTEASTTEAIVKLLTAYGQGRVAIVAPSGKSKSQNEYMKDHA